MNFRRVTSQTVALAITFSLLTNGLFWTTPRAAAERRSAPAVTSVPSAPPIPFIVASSGFFASVYDSAAAAVQKPMALFSMVSGKLSELASSETAVVPPSPAAVDFDFDGDGKADIGRWNSNSTDFRIKNSGGGSTTAYSIGTSGAIASPGDFDGDGMTDAAVFAAGTWTIRNSSSGQTQSVSFGAAGDKVVVGDYDGDGASDLAVFRSSNSTWYVKQSSNASTISTAFGTSGDIAVPADYDNDGKTDIAIYRPSTGYWWVQQSTLGLLSVQWGVATDIPIPGDYDGDGKADPTVYRASTGTWYVLKSSGNHNTNFTETWGSYGDQPVVGNYLGDSRADFAVWRPTTGVWYVKQNGGTATEMQGLGIAGDTAIPSAYVKQIGGSLMPYELAKARLSPRNATGGTDLYSQNFSWGTSLVGLPGRAGLDMGFGISYNSLVWTRQDNEIHFDTNIDNVSPGFRFGFPTIEPAYFVPGGIGSDPYWAYVMISPSGARTEFKQVGASAFFETADSSYLQIEAQAAPDPNAPVEEIDLVLRGTDGTQMSFNWKGGAFRASEIKDRNGNYITIEHDETGSLRKVTDTLGREITVNYDTELYPTTIQQTWKADNGSGSATTHTWATFSYTTQEIQTNFDSSLTVFGPPNGWQQKVLEKVTYPDGSHTKFLYNSYGQVKQVESYAPDNHKLNHVATNLASVGGTQVDVPRLTQTRSWVENFNQDSNGVEQETVVNNSFTAGQSYSLPGGLSGNAALIESTLVNHPDGLITKAYYGETGWMEGLPIATREEANGTAGLELKRWTWRAWTQDDVDSANQLNPRVTESRVGDGINTRKSDVVYDLYPGTTISKFGLVAETRTYDANLSNVIKRTEVDYKEIAAYLDRRIIGLPLEVRTFGWNDLTSTLEPATRVGYGYDEEDFSFETNQIISPIRHDSAVYGNSFVIGRGNLTSVTRYDVTGATASVANKTRYDIAGSVVAQLDPLGRKMRMEYADAFNDGIIRSAFAYPTRVFDPANNYSDVEYRFDIGANVWASSPAPAGQNVGKTTERLYDAIGRLEKNSVLSIGANTGAYIRYSRGNNGISHRTFSTLVDVDGDGADQSDEIATETWTDGAGRVRATRTEHPGSSGGWAARRTEYDVIGREKRSSVPTEVSGVALSDPAYWQVAGDDANRGYRWTQHDYDWMGRTIRVVPSDSYGTDGKDTLISYDGCGCAGGLITTVQGPMVPRTDAVGDARRKQKSYADILGRTWKTQTFKWDGTTQYLTTQSYFNGRDQVLASTQTDENAVVQTTTATFDGHGRLFSQRDPNDESGSQTTWVYNADDTIASVTDPRGAVTTYSYGNPNNVEKRQLLLGISYAPPSTQPSYTTIADTPDVNFQYDALGNRTYMQDGSGSTTYAYDPLSRLTSESKTFTGVSGNFTLAYTYQISGKLKSITDPFGDVINYNDDKAARTTSITGSSYAGITTYASGIDFRAFGGIKEMTYGSNDGSTITYAYDDALRPAEYEATSSVLTGGYVRRSTYEYFNDGAVKKVNNLLDPGLDQNYKFDQAGRLVSSVSGQKLNNEEEMEEPFTQIIQYNAFGNMTERTNEIWGSEASFTASYTNGRKTGGNEIYDRAGNLVDKTTASNNYNRWRYDAAGRNHETVMRWYQSIPTPTRDSTQTIAKIFDGDGLDVQRVDTDNWFSTFPTNTSGTVTSSEYYVRSTVLGGQIITKLDGDAEKKVTFVYAGAAVLAEQRVIGTTPGVYWLHEDIVTGSYSKIDSLGNYGGLADDSPTNVEYEPLGGRVEPSDPTLDPTINPVSLLSYKFAGDAGRPEYGCTLNGAPFKCELLGSAIRSSPHVEINVNTRVEGGYQLYSILSGMVSTWRYNVREVVDAEDPRLKRGHYGDDANWSRVGGRGPESYALLVGTFYAQYLSGLAETVINWTEDDYFRHMTDEYNRKKRVQDIIDYAKRAECTKAFEAAGVTPVKDQLANLTIVTETMYEESVYDTLWTRGSDVGKQMREVARQFPNSKDYAWPGLYGNTGWRFIGIPDSAFTQTTGPESEHLSVVLLHALVHSGGKEGIQQKQTWWDWLMQDKKHDLHYLGEKYKDILRECTRERGSKNIWGQ
ncbi:MAG: FG-GAP-like repeat-containing protein [Pyrinomonadaceae bacterium]|nr:FG-GAP-like repeat-containing protein [Pyrinomonadaceae bacterium]